MELYYGRQMQGVLKLRFPPTPPAANARWKLLDKVMSPKGLEVTYLRRQVFSGRPQFQADSFPPIKARHPHLSNERQRLYGVMLTSHDIIYDVGVRPNNQI